ncbi:hypothetical protein [Cupriavidus sp. Agwp_2]|uniref:hypothetical protein n=1 Tax=Cupriavidus sp. Agwp_2 TaxID=2897324 RepID=UPI003460A477
MRKPDIVFNDISIINVNVPDHSAAQKAFEDFVCTVGSLIDDDICNSIIRSSCCLQDVTICVNHNGTWNAADWFQDRNVDFDLRNLALTLDTKVPIEEGLILKDDQENELLSFNFNAGQANGPDCFPAGYCACIGDVLVSILTSPIWDTHQLQVCVTHEIHEERNIVIDHASRASHSDLLRTLFNGRRLASVETAEDFKKSKETLFPNLRFSPDVDDQIDRLDKHQLANAIAKLAKINETATNWSNNGTAVPDYRFQWSGESKPTMDNEAYRDARKFRMPEGELAIFENHVYFTGRHRIHFVEDRKARDFVIGYIGDHLPTVRFPH